MKAIVTYHGGEWVNDEDMFGVGADWNSPMGDARFRLRGVRSGDEVHQLPGRLRSFPRPVRTPGEVLEHLCSTPSAYGSNDNRRNRS